MLISCKDTCEKFFEEFTEKSGYLLNKPAYRESYICVISSMDGVLYENKIVNEQIYNLKYGDVHIAIESKIKDGKFVLEVPNVSCQKEALITSCGYNVKERISYSEIFINNINYSLNKIGLNFVVVDAVNNTIVDAFNVNTHNDSSLKINRIL